MYKRIAPPSKYPGGKYYLAPKLAEITKRANYTHYVEPYGGMLNLLFVLDPEGKSEIVVDCDLWLTNFWRVLQDRQTFEAFKREVEAIPPSEIAWNISRKFVEQRTPIPANWAPGVTEASHYFVYLRQSRQALCKDFMTMTTSRTRRGMNEQASAWWSSVEGLEDVYARLRRVVILDAQPAVKVIKKQDSKNTLYYLDPPYHPSTLVSKDQYRHVMTHEEHVELLDTLSDIEGKFVLSGYDCELYEQYRKRNKWKRTDIEIDNKASSKKVKDKKIEAVWTNF